MHVDTRLEELFAGVDDLIKRVADTDNPEVRKIRAKVRASMAPEEYPEPALGVALLVGVGLGVMMSIQP